MFAPGPAAATHSMSRLGSRRFSKLTGTGLAHPKRNPVNAVRIGTRMVPTGSMCRAGLRLVRPSIHAVLSPKNFAA